VAASGSCGSKTSDFGSDCADALGEGVTQFQVGQTVADLTVTGAYAEYICLPAQRLTPVPAELDPAKAVSMILTYVTAYQMLHRVAQAKLHERILIHGAGGAVGTALLELGGQLELEMYGTASQPKHETIRELGGMPIDYRNEDFVARIRELTGDGVDVAFDPIGGDHFQRSFSVLRPGGRLIGYGFQQAVTRGSGSLLSVVGGLTRFAFWNLWPNGKQARFYGITLQRKRHPDQFTEDLSLLFEMAAAGKLNPVIDRIMPLEEARRAHELIEQSAVTGKIVLTTQ